MITPPYGETLMLSGPSKAPSTSGVGLTPNSSFSVSVARRGS
jgi:hypothetical protein